MLTIVRAQGEAYLQPVRELFRQYLVATGARLIGYARLRLGSARFMTAASFREIEPDPESEIPAKFQKHWLFMELVL